MRSGRLLGLDTDAAHLAATGMVRLAAEEWRPGEVTAPAWRTRAVSFADAWLVLVGSAPGLRVPVAAVVRSLAYQAAALVLRAHQDDGPAALAWLGHCSADACDRAHRSGTAHPAEPAALALVWHATQSITAGGGPSMAAGLQAHDRRMGERAEAYIRGPYHRQDALALLLSCARITAAVLLRLSSDDPGQAHKHLEEHVNRFMSLGRPVPPWVPHHPEQPAG